MSNSRRGLGEHCKMAKSVLSVTGCRAGVEGEGLRRPSCAWIGKIFRLARFFRQDQHLPSAIDSLFLGLNLAIGDGSGIHGIVQNGLGCRD